MQMMEEQKVTLKEWRTQAGMTQAELAEAIGISQATLCRVETGIEPTSAVKRKINAHIGRGVIKYGGKRDTLAYLRDINPDAPVKPLKWWRLERHMTHWELERDSGVSGRTVQNIESGRVGYVRPSTKRKLAKALMVHPDKIVLPGEGREEELGEPGYTKSDLLRSELRAKERVLRRCYDFLRDGRYVTHWAQDQGMYVSLLSDVERELRGT